MHLLHELATEIIIGENEARKSDPISQGAIIGFDQLQTFVNSNQYSAPSQWRPADYYQYVAPQFAYLKEVTIPPTGAMIYVTTVGIDVSNSEGYEYFVPPIDKLIHDPRNFGYSEELDREFAAKRPTKILTWTKSICDNDDQCLIEYLDIHGIGIDPEQRSNSWMTFSRREDAERYRDEIKLTIREPSELHKAFIAELELMTREFDEDYYESSEIT